MCAWTAGLIAPVLDLLASERPAAERATAAASMLNELFDASRSQVPVYLAALAAAPHVPVVRTGLGDLWTELRSRVADDIDRQLKAGLLSGWVSPSPMAALIISLINGVVVASVVDPGRPDHRDVATQFLSLLLAAGGLRDADPKSAPAVSRNRRRR